MQRFSLVHMGTPSPNKGERIMTKTSNVKRVYVYWRVHWGCTGENYSCCWHRIEVKNSRELSEWQEKFLKKGFKEFKDWMAREINDSDAHSQNFPHGRLIDHGNVFK